MSPEDQKALVIGYIESLNRKKLPSKECLAPDFVFHDPGMPDANQIRQGPTFCSAQFQRVS